jgi:hypothetical protein
MGCLSAFKCEEKKNPKYARNITYIFTDLPDIEIVRQSRGIVLTIVSILSALTVENIGNGTCIVLLVCERHKEHKKGIMVQ